MLREFREFAIRGNVVDMAVGIIVGGAFGTIARSLVNDVVMPPIGLLLGGVDFQDLFVVLREGVDVSGPYASLAAAQAAGAVTVNWGLFVNNVLSFLIVAWAVFFLVRFMNRIQRKKEAATAEPEEETRKSCPFCISEIAIAASRCPNCTSELTAA